MRSSSLRSGPGVPAPAARLAAEYVLPLKWADDRDLAELTAYLEELAGWLDVTVVDGSAAEVFERHRLRWSGLVRHISPRPWPGHNGKVAGVVTGVAAARHDRVVIADDDVRWQREELSRALSLLERADLVRPQNYFEPLPWHARWDTGRSLINRAFGSDYPGTYALRRDTFLQMGGYDGHALFENLELARTVRAAGGTEVRADDLFVRRCPPTAAHFWGQRARQAYDDLAQPARLLAELSIGPGMVLLLHRGHRAAGPFGAVTAAAIAATAAVGVAEIGRRRHGGARVFDTSSAWWAPLWLTERALLVWCAVWSRFRGGIRYGDHRLVLAANRTSILRRRLGSTAPLRPSTGEIVDPTVRDETEPPPRHSAGS